MLSQTNYNNSNYIINNNNISNNINNNITINNEEILKQQKIMWYDFKEKIWKRKWNIKRTKKNELKSYDKVAQELIESKNEKELKEYLFRQLVFLD